MDITVTIPVSTVSYLLWLKTSYIGFGITDDKGTSLVDKIEIGPDQKDIFSELMKQSSREVLKSFVSRQGDVTGTPFEYSTTNVIYRVNECEPVLTQASALKSELEEDVKNAIYTYVTMLWFRLKGNEKYSALFLAEFSELQASIQGILHRLHD